MEVSPCFAAIFRTRRVNINGLITNWQPCVYVIHSVIMGVRHFETPNGCLLQNCATDLTLGAQGRPFGKLTLSVGGLRGGGGGGGWMMTSRSKGSTSPSMPLSASSGSSSSSRASSFLKGSRSLYVSKLSCLTRGWGGESRGSAIFGGHYLKTCVLISTL